MSTYNHGRDKSPEELVREHVNDLEAKVERLQAGLLKRARLYQRDDGSPGPLAYVWGWRDISKHLRAAAEEVGGEG